MKRHVGTSPDSGFPNEYLPSQGKLDYDGLEHALKRVKISASPGQLRLENDLESLIRHHCWTEFREDDHMEEHETYPASVSAENYKCLISPSKLQHIQRDVADPLRFYVTLIHPADHSDSNHVSLCLDIQPPQYITKWIFHVQIPRMYPHCPPTVHRIIKAVVDSNGQELYRITSDGCDDVSDNIQSEFYSHQGTYIQVMHRAQNPCVTVSLSEELQKSSFVAHIEHEKAYMLTAFIFSSGGLINDHAQSEKETISRIGSQDHRKGHSLIMYNDMPYHNMAIYPHWSPILQLSEFITMLMDVSYKKENILLEKMAKGES